MNDANPTGDSIPADLVHIEREVADAVHAAAAEVRRFDLYWDRRSRQAQLRSIKAAMTRTLESVPTLAELRADAHERRARLQLGALGRGPVGPLPLAYIDVRPIKGTPAMRRFQSWIMQGWAYVPRLRGWVSGYAVRVPHFDVIEILSATLDAPSSAQEPLPVCTEDRALRSALADLAVQLGPRLTTVIDDQAALLTAEWSAHSPDDTPRRGRHYNG